MSACDCQPSRFGSHVLVRGGVFLWSLGCIRLVSQLNYLAYQSVLLVGECERQVRRV